MSAEVRPDAETLRGARVLFTDRAAGNLSTLAGSGRERGAERREALRAALALSALRAGAQEHGTRINIVRESGQAGAPADGHATAVPNVGVMILAADCLPVALATDDAVAVVHAGWRGLSAGVLEAGVAALRDLSDGPVDALIGPAAGRCCYEVGGEVFAALGAPATADRRIDLRSIARRRLRAAGVAEVRDVDRCTICDERYFSHRREGVAAGRQAVIAWLT